MLKRLMGQRLYLRKEEQAKAKVDIENRKNNVRSDTIDSALGLDSARASARDSGRRTVTFGEKDGSLDHDAEDGDSLILPDKKDPQLQIAASAKSELPSGRKSILKVKDTNKAN